ncbi:MAG: Type 1 glutamine amidotransferase-like domain-containing protein [Thermoleophilia bacterium]
MAPGARIRSIGRPRQIIALGGGGFTEEPDRPALDDYVLEASGRDLPRILFLPTAGGDNPSYVVKFYAAFSGGHCVPSHLPLFNRTEDDIRSILLSQDVIYVGGGNTANLLAVWRAHGVDEILAEAWRRGVVLAGLCAGSMCWFESGVTASFGRRLTVIEDGLGLLPGSNCPHYLQRRDAYLGAIGGGMPSGLAVEDGVALHFVDLRLAAVVASRDDRRAYRVGLAGDRVIEAPLRPIVLGSRDRAAARAPRSVPAQGAPAALAAVS